MIHYFIGHLGHLATIAAFVTILLAAFSYYKYATVGGELQKAWKQNARTLFYVHAISVLLIVISLFVIVYNHYFEYHYAYSHSSRDLPVHYLISSFWNGQEGSFLLWMFWHAVIGILFIHLSGKWESSAMFFFSLVQAFLSSMILGIVIFNLKIGSSPFLLTRDVLDVPIFQMNPDFIPSDGAGLNPLLQNYWMVIHPPTLFLGFAATIIPFALVLAGLWKGEVKAWVKPALPWSIAAAAVLGTGILMGGYWAYETLNFGGYWNWDPVENAVYVPWLILVASIHTMILFKNSNTALRLSVILVVSMYVLILYSTFLVRSGVLGDSSVHSFTDLGLSGQLLLYLLFFLGLSVVFMVRRWKEIPMDQKEASVYSREFWIFIGVTVLSLMAFQVILPTSIPVFNALLGTFNIDSNLAPPADQVGYYTKWQLWFAVAVAILSGTGQFFYWKKMKPELLKEALLIPLLLTLVFSGLVIYLAQIYNVVFIVLLTTSVYSIVANAKIMIDLARKRVALSGGSVAHIGVALMLIGILASSGYSKTISRNNSGLLLFNDLTEDRANENVENLLLWYNDPEKMTDFSVRYTGKKVELRNYSGLMDLNNLRSTDDPSLMVVREDVKIGRKQFQKGDTLKVHPENTYYEVTYTENDGDVFRLYPRWQINPQMGNVVSPDIRRTVTKDMYTHLMAISNPPSEKEWTQEDELIVRLDSTFFVHDYIAELKKVERVDVVEGVAIEGDDLAVKAVVDIQGPNGGIYTLTPYYILKDRVPYSMPATLSELGVKLTFNEIRPAEETFVFGLETAQQDYIILKAIVKPGINILWLGTVVLVIGFGIATYRRFVDFYKSK